MSASIQSTVKADLVSAVLNDEKDAIIQTYTVKISQVQVLNQLSGLMQQLKSLQDQQVKTQAMIDELKKQSDLFITPQVDPGAGAVDTPA